MTRALWTPTLAALASLAVLCVALVMLDLGRYVAALVAFVIYLALLVFAHGRVEHWANHTTDHKDGAR